MARAKPPETPADGPLARYRAKRDFSRTSEPAGLTAPAPGHRFVVHQHHATADHYDLRLELDGVLKSWAVPKGPSLDPADRRLAVETEDHPLDYIDYEGVIPAGAYGAGPTIVWDTGTWAPMGDAAADLAAGTLKFRLSGQKLDGGFMLTRLRPKPGERRRNWLLIKERDAAAAPGGDILAERPDSVKTGRPIGALTAPPPLVRHAALRPDRLPGAVRGPLPDRLPPQLATETAAPPEGGGWLHEIKLDGYRTLARVEDGAARLITRAGLDWSHRYGDLPAIAAALPCRSALLDGEVVVLDAHGVSHFAALQAALSDGRGDRLVFFAFDLPHLNGWDLTAVPLARRKDLLARLLTGSASGLQYGGHVEGGGGAFFARAAELGLEGVVSKRADSPYTPGRSKAWTKAKTRATGDFLVAGYTASPAAGGLGALALAERRGGALAYVGKVGTGFAADDHAALLARLAPLREGATRLAAMPKDVIPVRPDLTARVHYATRTRDGALRHAVFQGLRDPMPAELVPEKLVSEADLAKIHITNPTRRLFGRSGPTKLDVAVYYAAIGNVMLPHLTGRPVSLVRCPSGKPEDCFFQRHAFTGMPDGVSVVHTTSSDGEARSYLAIATPLGYLALPQFGTVEFHTWGARAADIDRPDRVVFDLDPGEGIAWREVVEAAAHVRDELARLGLVPFVKTTGGRGVHVVVPTTPGPDWKAVHAATAHIAKAIAATAPGTFTTTMGEKNRRGRIFIDFHRNARSATAVAPYSLRARNNLPASAPLSWEMLATVDAPSDLNYSSLPELVAGTGDPWAKIDSFARDLPAPLRRE